VLLVAGSGVVRLCHRGQNSRPPPIMSVPRATSILPATLVRTIVSLPLMLLATALWAAAHAENLTATDLAIQAMLVLFMIALLVNVILSVVANLRERHVLDPPAGGASSFVAEVEQRSIRAAPPGNAPPVVEAPREHAPPPQALSKRS
jgi:hypothetical protein